MELAKPRDFNEHYLTSQVRDLIRILNAQIFIKARGGNYCLVTFAIRDIFERKRIFFNICWTCLLNFMVDTTLSNLRARESSSYVNPIL